MAKSVSLRLRRARPNEGWNVEVVEHAFGLDKATIKYHEVNEQGVVIGVVWVKKSDLAKLASSESWPEHLRLTLEEASDG